MMHHTHRFAVCWRYSLKRYAPICLLLAGGCTRTTWVDTNPDLRGPAAVAERPVDDQVRILPIFTGEGEPMGWDDLMDACGWAEVIVVGEQHNDAVGHSVQRAIVTDVIHRFRDEQCGLAMEMLERDEQILVDDYRDDVIDAEQFAKLTNSERWAGEGSWANWYQPIIDAAMSNGSAVIAANAPRRYVSYARTDGYDALERLPKRRRALFDFPTSLRTGGYRDRFYSLMRDMGDHSDPSDDHAMHVTDAQIASMYRAQMLWDATMAKSVVSALREDQEKVVLLVGQFHADYNGGTMQELRRRSPTSRIMSVSMVPRGTKQFNEEDRDRADIIIYTPVIGEHDEADEPTEDDESRADDERDGEATPPHPEVEYDAPKPVAPPHGDPNEPVEPEMPPGSDG